MEKKEVYFLGNNYNKKAMMIMSMRNFFIIKSQQNVNIEEMYMLLSDYVRSKTFGIVFNPKGYADEILEALEYPKYCFALTDNENCIECEEIFSTYEAFQYAKTFPRKHYAIKEHEFLRNQLIFLDDILEIVFRYANVDAVDFYLSDQYSTLLEDYHYVVEVADRQLTDALISTFMPRKKARYFGVKTTKFSISR